MNRNRKQEKIENGNKQMEGNKTIDRGKWKKGNLDQRYKMKIKI